MWKNNCFVSYLHAERRTEAFFFGILILEGAVYSLYGLPWGPAIRCFLPPHSFFWSGEQDFLLTGKNGDG